MTDVNLGERMALLDAETVGLVQSVLDLAPRGLAAAYVGADHGFAHTLRLVGSENGDVVQREGSSVRYAAIAALGLSRLDEEEQRRALGGLTAAEISRLAAARALEGEDPGAIAIAAWAQAEINGSQDGALVARMHRLLSTRSSLATVEVAWMLTAAVAARGPAETDEVVQEASSRLVAGAGDHAIFPHRLPGSAHHRWRAHVGSFADQVYPVQALARAAAARGETAWLRLADRTADRLVELQGVAGQWWWHYDTRDGTVVEPYPVYSVHQHAMAPMALHDLREAGGADHTGAVAKGARWLLTHPEVVDDLISERWGVVWRKVGRREPRKAARGLQAAYSSVRPGARIRGLDRLMPATVVDHECRPYELGWLLYAWLPPAGAR